jgi:hypothetical protein
MKPQKPTLIQYILATPTEEILDGAEVTFAGETEKDRLSSTVKFIRIRGIIQRYSQSLTPDDNETLVAIMKACVVQKTPE